jgi:hypothetical protein
MTSIGNSARNQRQSQDARQALPHVLAQFEKQQEFFEREKKQVTGTKPGLIPCCWVSALTGTAHVL